MSESVEFTYTTKRKMLMERRAFLIKTVEEAQSALSGLMSGEISSYNLGSWSVSRSKLDLDKLSKWISQAYAEIDAITNILSGRAPRHTSTYIYRNPANVNIWDLLGGN